MSISAKIPNIKSKKPKSTILIASNNCAISLNTGTPKIYFIKTLYVPSANPETMKIKPIVPRKWIGVEEK